MAPISAIASSVSAVEVVPPSADVVPFLHAADVVVVKRGCSGATVHRPGRDPVAVPAYRSARVFKIGSGDVFSAAFAHHWGERGLDAAATWAGAGGAAARLIRRWGGVGAL